MRFPLLIVLLTVSCGEQLSLQQLSIKAPQKVSIPSHFEAVPRVENFFFIHSSKDQQATDQKGDLASCREQISSVICLTDNSENPQCQEGGKEYAHFFEELFDNYPPALQKMFCSVRHIYVLNTFFATAYAGLIKDKDGQTIGAQMGIRRSLLDEKLSLEQWASWKEQLSFGGNIDTYTPKPDLPSIATSTAADVNDLLYFVVTHEFGHMFDFANQLNKTVGPIPTHADQADVSKQWPFTKDSWGALSWINETQPLQKERFPYRRGLCFYMCDGEPMSRSAVPELYRGLSRANFLSTYAASNPYDDFADSLAYYAMDRNLGTSYSILTEQGTTYDIMEKLHDPIMELKLNYIESFLKQPDLKYP